MTSPFPSEPSLTLFDPLADLLGAGDGRLHYRFDDIVKLSGHACPTVAGAFLMGIKALEALYGDQVPTRGNIKITSPGTISSGVNGPISQVLTFITGAAGDNGFHGLGGHYRRSGLLEFTGDSSGDYTFRRTDTNAAVCANYNPSSIPPAPEMGSLLQQVLQGEGDSDTKSRFQKLWRDRVMQILQDEGTQTIFVTHC